MGEVISLLDARIKKAWKEAQKSDEPESSDLKAVAQRNRENQARICKERAENNERTKRAYKVKPKRK